MHPEILKAQQLPGPIRPKQIWQQRYESILGDERKWAHNGTVIIKFWLNVSKEEQLRRFIRRLEKPHKNWKFSEGDVAERKFWPKYMQAYQEALAATSRPWAPWYAIPADSKPFMRLAVARIVVDTIANLNVDYPTVTVPRRRELMRVLEQLKSA